MDQVQACSRADKQDFQPASGRCLVGMVQMNVTASVEQNLRRAAEGVRQCVLQGAQIVMLPEMFCCPYVTRLFPQYAQPAGGSVWQAMAAMAAENAVLLVGGTIPEQEGDCLYNTCFVFDAKGRQIARHRKVHLFDIAIKGGQLFQESRTFTAGDSVTVVDTPYGKIGIAICFDIRFPEQFRLMAEDGAQMIFVPAAFNMTTGPQHWELCFRSRAVDNQCFLFGCAAARDEQAPYISYANSIAVSPWGRVLGRLDTQEDILLCSAELAEVAEVRAQLPLLSGLRRDLFAVRRAVPAEN